MAAKRSSIRLSPRPVGTGVVKDADFRMLQAKIAREYPVRKKLAAILNRAPGDSTIRDLFVDIQIFVPEKALEARELIAPLGRL